MLIIYVGASAKSEARTTIAASNSNSKLDSGSSTPTVSDSFRGSSDKNYQHFSPIVVPVKVTISIDLSIFTSGDIFLVFSAKTNIFLSKD